MQQHRDVMHRNRQILTERRTIYLGCREVIEMRIKSSSPSCRDILNAVQIREDNNYQYLPDPYRSTGVVLYKNGQTSLNLRSYTKRNCPTR